MFLRKLFRFVPRSTLRRALSLFNRGEFESAATLFDEILEVSDEPPEDVTMYTCETYVEIGKRRTAGGDLPGAVQALERAATLRPGYADVQFRLGQLYENTDEPGAARQAYEKALVINPRYFEARLSLARLLMQLDAGKEALRHLQEAASSGPEFASGELQELMRSVPQDGQPPEPTRKRLDTLFDKLLSGPPSPVWAGVEVAREALRSGHNTLAISEIKKLLKMHPEFPDLHNLLGVAYDNEEMVDDAIEEFEHALLLNRDYVDARLNLGLTLFGRGRYDDAERHLRRVEETQPGHRLVQSVLSQIETRGGVP